MKNQFVLSLALLGLVALVSTTQAAIQTPSIKTLTTAQQEAQPAATLTSGKAVEGSNEDWSNRIKNWWNDLWHKTKHAGESIADKSSQAWDKTKEYGYDASHKAKETAETAWDKTKELGHEAKEKAAGAWDKTKEYGYDAGHSVKETAGKVWDTIKSPFVSTQESATTATTAVNTAGKVGSVKTV